MYQCNNYWDTYLRPFRFLLSISGCFCPAGTVELGKKCVSEEECPTESPEQQCPEGKVFQECGTACPKTCDNKDELTFCTKQCVQGEQTRLVLLYV